MEGLYGFSYPKETFGTGLSSVFGVLQRRSFGGKITVNLGPDLVRVLSFEHFQ